jgi:hypothetical protein
MSPRMALAIAIPLGVLAFVVPYAGVAALLCSVVAVYVMLRGQPS